MSAKASSVSACLFNGLRKFGVRNVRSLGFKNEVRRFQFFVIIAVNNDVGEIVGRSARNSDLKADAIRAIIVSVDEFGPEFSPHLFFRVAPSFRVPRVNVMDALRLTFARELYKTVFNSVLEKRWLGRIHGTSLLMVRHAS